MRTAIAVQGAKEGFRDALETKIHVDVGWKPFISSGKAPFPPALVLKETCKHPFFSSIPFHATSFLFCLAGKTPGKNVETPDRKDRLL
jgi:hypothetical protein